MVVFTFLLTVLCGVYTVDCWHTTELVETRIRLKTSLCRPCRFFCGTWDLVTLSTTLHYSILQVAVLKIQYVLLTPVCAASVEYVQSVFRPFMT